METLIADVRYAFRTLWKTPGFTAIAVLSLALGIGANTAIFTIIDTLMLRQLPVHEPDRLFLIGKGQSAGIFGGIFGAPMDLVSEPQLAALRKDHRFFQDAAGIFSLHLTYHGFVAGAQNLEPVKVDVVTGNYFFVLGVSPARGRFFTDGDDQPLNTHADVVISNSWWKRRFNGNAGTVGQHIRIAERIYTIIGIAPPEFFGTTVGEWPDAWIPLSMQAALPPYFDFHASNLMQSLNVIGRLKPGVAPEQASTGLTLFMQQLLRSYSGTQPSSKRLQDIAKTTIVLSPAAKGLSSLRDEFSHPLRILMVVVSLVLLVACANVANLLLARATVREREMAIRFAVGSGRGRVLKQLLTESVVLSLAGGIAGIIVAMWGTEALLALVSSPSDPVALNVEPNLRVLGFSLCLSVITGLLFGIAPALRASSVNLNSGLRDGRGGTASRSRMFTGRALVVSQVAVSLVLLAAAGLFVRSFRNLERIDTGFRRENSLQFTLKTEAIGRLPDEQLISLYQRIEERVARVPGVDAASFSMFGFNQGSENLTVGVEGHPEVLANGKACRFRSSARIT